MFKKITLFTAILAIAAIFVGCNDDDNTTAKFSWDYAEGFFIKGGSFADFVELEGDVDNGNLIAVHHYKGDNTIVVEYFAPSPNMPMYGPLVVTGATLSSSNGKTILSGATTATYYMDMGGNISANACGTPTVNIEIIGSEAMFELPLSMAGMGGAVTDYTTRFYGTITTNEGSYTPPATVQ